MIKAIVFDLDDTLFPEIEYVKSGFHAISNYYNDEKLYNKLLDLFINDKNNVYQRAGLSDEKCNKCIEIYRSHMPTMTLDNETKEVLLELKNSGYLLGIITDGRPDGQHNKIKALGLDTIMDCVIVTDELAGIELRKPNAKAFELMREKLGIEFNEMIYVGDNPTKDFYIGSIYPIITVQVESSGLYTKENYYKEILPTYKIKSLNDLLVLKRMFEKCIY